MHNFFGNDCSNNTGCGGILGGSNNCNLLMLLLLCGGGLNFGGCDFCSLVLLMLILNCLCGNNSNQNCNC